jgi:hypothetical protein
MTPAAPERRPCSATAEAPGKTENDEAGKEDVSRCSLPMFAQLSLVPTMFGC